MGFDYDPAKSRRNKAKHGIDFAQAQELWADPDAVGFPARCEDEIRYAIMAMVEGKLWMGIYTLRDGAIRIISVRRARKEESRLYESKRSR
jgi:uncharacterized protein